VAAYPEEVFARLARQLAQAPLAERRVRDFQRLFFARAQRVVPDSQWRLRLPADLAQAASLATEAVLVGVHDHVEIWEPGVWERLVAEQQKQYDQLAEYAWSACRPDGGRVTSAEDVLTTVGSQHATPPSEPLPDADAPPKGQRPPQPR
jgi:division/cell wall cluster transcriptional repressor MraZ